MSYGQWLENVFSKFENELSNDLGLKTFPDVLAQTLWSHVVVMRSQRLDMKKKTAHTHLKGFFLGSYLYPNPVQRRFT